MDYRGPLFRAANPVYARDPLSGRGAEIMGGRFNRRGRPALYLAFDILTTVREMARGGPLQPVTIVQIDAVIQGLLDSRDTVELSRHGADAALLADPGWRLRMHEGRPVPTQDLAERLIAAGHCGMIVRSFAPGTTEANLNLVLWSWGKGPPAALRVVDDQHRLG